MTVHGTPSRPAHRVAAACLLAAAGVLLAPSAPARAGADGPCDDPDGVTVVVDFEGFRDEVVVRCAAAPVESGYDALRKAGFDVTPTQRHPGFLCRIDGLPADDPCVTTPPADAYWGYWRAERGGRWGYSDRGPATTTPPPGPVEGWAFSTGDDGPPRVAPPDPSAPDPGPAATSEPAPSSAPSPVPAPTATPAAPAPAAASSPPAPATDPTATPRPTASPDPTATDRDLAVTAPPTPSPHPTASDDLATAPAAADDGGPPPATLAGAALVAAVGGAALLAARRRRRP